MASLELAGLRRRFGPGIALDGLTLSVPPGQVFGFLGPNGAGNSITMRAVFSVVAPTRAICAGASQRAA